MPDNLRHAQYSNLGNQIDDPRDTLRKGATYTNLRRQVGLKFHGQIQSNAGVLNNTLRGIYEIPFPYLARRFRMQNMTTAPQINCIASSAIGPDVASLASNSPVFSPVLVAGVQSHTRPTALSGAGTDNAVPSEVISDWLYEPPMPRTDGGRGYLMAFQEFVTNVGNTTGNRCDIASTSIAHNITKVKAYFKGGDCVTTPANFVAPTEWTMAPAVWMEFLTAGGLVSLHGYGDSTVQGSDSGPMPNVAGAGRLVSEAYYGRVSFANFGWASQTSAASLANAIAIIPQTIPTFALFCPWSPNDADKYTAAGIARMIEGALTFISLCNTYGVVPGLLTPCPMNGITSGEESFRRQIVEWVKAKCAQDSIICVDRDSRFTNYGSASGGFISGLNATALHPNQTGQSLDAALNWAPAVAAMF